MVATATSSSTTATTARVSDTITRPGSEELATNTTKVSSSDDGETRYCRSSFPLHTSLTHDITEASPTHFFDTTRDSRSGEGSLVTAAATATATEEVPASPRRHHEEPVSCNLLQASPVVSSALASASARYERRYSYRHRRDAGHGTDSRQRDNSDSGYDPPRDQQAVTAHKGARQPALPPPVACTLVAFEPGSLGLELEAVAVESTGGGRGGQRRGEGQAEGRRLGCRVFRVTPDGQAARHGSVHPGDALVVLDGVDVLSEPFDAITQALLERQGRRRLVGFMGAAAVASASRAPIVSGLSALSDRRSSSRRPTATDEATGRALRQLESPREHNRDREPQQREGGDQRSEVGGEKGLDFETGGGGGADGGDGGCSAVVSGSTGESKRRSSSTNRATDEREGHRRQDERFPQSPSAAGSLTGSVKESSHHDHAYRSASIRRQSESSMPALLDDARRHPYTTKGEDSRGGGGRWASPTNIAGDSARTRIRQAGEHVRSSVVNSDKYSRYSSTGRGIGVGRGGGGGGGGGGSLRNSWGSAASTMMMATSSGRLLGDRMRPLERSRGESLQRSLEEAMQEKTALAAERAWLLEELQRAKEATLEREGAIAGQEVQTDVLKMELNAVETELRRARQELGACEAGRRELNEAAKQDIARRDREAADLSSQLHRERAAREREASAASAAVARAVATEAVAARAAATARAEIAEARKRAEKAESSTAEAEEKVMATHAAAKEAALDATAAMRRERERREMDVREREEETSSLMLSLEAAEGRARKIVQDKEAQLRELEQVAVRSLELAERRRSESEDKAAAASTRLREREAELAKEERRLKELESQLRQAYAASKRELEEMGDLEARKLTEKLEYAEKALTDEQVRAKGESEKLSERLKGAERKLSSALERLRNTERRARMAETGADAARKRAEAMARKQEELSDKLAAEETGRACQRVTVTALKTQLEQLRRTSSAGDASLREAVRLREVLQEAMAIQVAATLPPHSPMTTTAAAGSVVASNSASKGKSLTGRSGSGVGVDVGVGEPEVLGRELDAKPGASLVCFSSCDGRNDVVDDSHGGCNGGVVGGDCGGELGGGDWASVALVDLAEALRKRLKSARGELERLREVLAMTREEKEALRERGEDAAELRSLLEEKRGLSTELARRVDAARARTEHAEEEAERIRGEAASLRVELEVTEKLLEEQTERVVELAPRAMELEQGLSNKTAEAEAAAVRAQRAEEEMATVLRDLHHARNRQTPLEEAMSAAEAERMGAMKRLIRKDGELLTVQTRLEAALAELEAVKLSIFQIDGQVMGVLTGEIAHMKQLVDSVAKSPAGIPDPAAPTGNANRDIDARSRPGSADQRVFRQYKACVLLASTSTRRRVESVEVTIAMLRWRQQCHRPPTLPPSTIPGERWPTPRGWSVGSSDHTRGEEAGMAGWRPAAAEKGRKEEEKVAGSTTVVLADAQRLAKVDADILEVERCTRSELAIRMCGTRVLAAVLQKWAARQLARTFWRLRAPDCTVSMNASAAVASAADAMPFVDVASLRITAPASFEEPGQTRSPAGKSDGGSGDWDVRSSPAAVLPPSSRGGVGGGGNHDRGIKSTATDATMGMPALELVDRMSRDPAQPYASTFRDEGPGHRKDSVNFRVSPPQSPSSTWGNAVVGFHGTSAAYHTSHATNTADAGCPNNLSFEDSGTLIGGNNMNDLSFASATSSEPRYHCLWKGDRGESASLPTLESPLGSPLGAPSPVWVCALSVSGGEEDERGTETGEQCAELADAYRRSPEGGGGRGRGGERSNKREPVTASGTSTDSGGGSNSGRNGGRGGAGGGERAMRDESIVSPSGNGFGLRVEVAESEGSWWALSDESV